MASLRASKDDIQGVVRGFTRDLDQLRGVWYRSSLEAHPFLSQEFFEQELLNIPKAYVPMAEMWIHEEEGRVTGLIALVGDEVGALFVDPAFQSRGTGRALLDLARRQRDFLELEVFKANTKGRAFYARYGFHEIGESIDAETGHPVLRLRCEDGGG